MAVALAGGSGSLVRGSADGQWHFSGELSPGEEPATFAFFGDWGVGLAAVAPARVTRMVKSWSPDFIVTGGDNNYGGVTVGHPHWDEYLGFRFGEFMLGRADRRYPLQSGGEARFFPVVGNHDTSVGGLGGGTIEGYFDYFIDGGPDGGFRLPLGGGRHDATASYYDFVRGDVHFVMADSDPGRINVAFAAAQRQWILERFQASDARWKILVAHHPPYSSDGVHGSQTWMQGAHLLEADLVLAGHAHVYERLEKDGVAFITCGLGGRSIYRLAEDPLPETVFRTNATYGAVRVQVTSSGLRTEFRQISDTAPDGDVVDTLTLGEFREATNGIDYPIEVIAGRTLTLTTTTPGGADNRLDPRLILFGPDGAEVAADADGDGDGRNAVIRHVAAQSGRYRVRVAAETGDPGAFELAVLQDPPLPLGGWEVWRRQRFGDAAAPDTPGTGPNDDPDRDGTVNLLEYAGGTDPLKPDPGTLRFSAPNGSGKRCYLTLELPDGYRDDVQYVILASANARPDSWQVLGVRPPQGAWLWAAGVFSNEYVPDGGGSGVRALVGPGTLTKSAAFRLGVVLAP